MSKVKALSYFNRIFVPGKRLRNSWEHMKFYWPKANYDRIMPIEQKYIHISHSQWKFNSWKESMPEITPKWRPEFIWKFCASSYMYICKLKATDSRRQVNISCATQCAHHIIHIYVHISCIYLYICWNNINIAGHAVIAWKTLIWWSRRKGQQQNDLQKRVGADVMRL